MSFPYSAKYFSTFVLLAFTLRLTAAGVIISSVLPDPYGTDSGKEKITLENKGNKSESLTGWKITDKRASYKLSGVILSNSKKIITLPENSFGKVSLNNNGDTITLYNQQGQKIDEFKYSEFQVKRGKEIHSKKKAANRSPNINYTPPTKKTINSNNKPKRETNYSPPRIDYISPTKRNTNTEDNSEGLFTLGIIFIIACAALKVVHLLFIADAPKIENKTPSPTREKKISINEAKIIYEKITKSKRKLSNFNIRIGKSGKRIDKIITNKINQLHEKITSEVNGDYYLRKNVISKLHNKISSDNELKLINNLHGKTTAEWKSKFKDIEQFLNDPERIRKSKNKSFINKELRKFQRVFDTDNLTEAQRVAVVTNEENNLVLAGAGSGKTKVIISRVNYLIEKNLTTPRNILILAFAKEAAEELEERILERLKIKIEVRTFHSLGLDIIGKATSKKPAVLGSTSNKISKDRLMHDIFSQLAMNPKEWNLFYKFFSEFLSPFKDHFSFNNTKDYIAYTKQVEFRAINGDLVKGYCEMLIANYLIENGIKFKYEANYIHQTNSTSRRQYQPDFFLTESKTYIEFFGLDKNNNPPAYINKSKYINDLKWKQKIHKDNETDLIELYYWQILDSQFDVSACLDKELKKRDIKIKPIAAEQILEQLSEGGIINQFSKLCTTFISHFKSNNLSNDDLEEKINEVENSFSKKRLASFIKAFKHIFDIYENHLKENNCIDFDDMIRDAQKHTNSNQYSSDFEHILVDEFQDISIGRANLLKALKKSNPKSTLFTVGDDWQSIYRFAGSDISVMTNYENHFGNYALTKLDKTFRFNNQILDFSKRFIMQNPSQLDKDINSNINLNNPQVFVAISTNSESDLIELSLKKIANKKERATILILGRYKFNYPQKLSDWKTEFQQLEIQYKTIHSSKGREADYVILIGLTSGKWGFPSEIIDDPILDLVLPKKEKHLNAEERRLFYVAVTRARKQCFLLSCISNPLGRKKLDTPSAFIDEIIKGNYNVAQLESKSTEIKFCKKCSTGILFERKHNNRTFHSCSNYPICT